MRCRQDIWKQGWEGHDETFVTGIPVLQEFSYLEYADTGMS
jgi:hypothetical protein